MKKNKKLFLASIAAMGAVAIGTGAVSTFAWYQASGSAASKGSTSGTGTLVVANNSVDLGGVKITIEPHTGYATEMAFTNRSGRSYYVVEGNKTELLAGNANIGSKQKSTTWDVSLIGWKNDAQVDLTVDMLAAAHGTYTVEVNATGSAKLSLSATADVESTTDDATKVDFASLGTMATGALGADHDQTVNVMQIVISDTGVVTRKIDATAGTPFSGAGTTWSITTVGGKKVCAAAESAPTYYGIEVKLATGEAYDALDEAHGYTLRADTALTPDLA